MEHGIAEKACAVENLGLIDGAVPLKHHAYRDGKIARAEFGQIQIPAALDLGADIVPDAVTARAGFAAATRG